MRNLWGADLFDTGPGGVSDIGRDPPKMGEKHG
jgi:hypothetical protein